MNQLSILIPTYNKVCFELVKNLQAQASLCTLPTTLPITQLTNKKQGLQAINQAFSCLIYISCYIIYI